jgi:acetyl esterase/lipase
MRFRLLLTAAVLTASTCLFAQAPALPPGSDHPTLPLWPKVAPGAQTATGPEGDATTEKDGTPGGKRVIRMGNVSTPTLTLYAPKGNNTGAAVLVFPGGGYRILAFDLEGTEVCDWLNTLGVNCILVKYRVPQPGPFPKSTAPLADAQRAVGMVRQHAAEWHIDPNKIGVLGFSAGGHLAALISTHFAQRVYDPVDEADKLSCRPDFTVLIYPAYLVSPEQNFALNPEMQPNAQTPPTFLAQAEDDPVHVENVLMYFLALKNAKVPAELHVYAEGGHGYGLRRTAMPVTSWPKEAGTWLETIHMLPGTK